MQHLQSVLLQSSTSGGACKGSMCGPSEFSAALQPCFSAREADGRRNGCLFDSQGQLLSTSCSFQHPSQLTARTALLLAYRAYHFGSLLHSFVFFVQCVPFVGAGCWMLDTCACRMPLRSNILSYWTTVVQMSSSICNKLNQFELVDSAQEVYCPFVSI